MHKKAGSVLNLMVALSMVLAMLAAQPALNQVSAQDGPTPPVPVEDLPGAWALQDLVAGADEVSPEAALDKLDPSLRVIAQNGGKDVISLYVSVAGEADLEQYLTSLVVRPSVFAGVRNYYGQALPASLIKIAQQPGVIAVVDAGGEMRDKPYDPEREDAPARSVNLARLEQLRANDLTFAEAQAKAQGSNLGARGWFDVQDGHKSAEAWKKGFTGEGVIVGVLDDGVDFAHPDLQGTYAWVTDPESPYYGWPMAFSQVSTRYFALDVILGTNLIASGGNGSRWTDTQKTFEAHPSFEGSTTTVSYQPLGSGIAHNYTIPTRSLSNFYKLGSFPEKNLLEIYGERVAVLVLDEHQAGVYDTVYVDLDNDYDFTDEKPATQDSPEIYRDMDGDGYADISGGMLVWVSDGANPPPTAEWLWGVTCADSSETMKGCPDSGELVLFAGPFDAGYTHGTQCASNVAGQGVVNGGLTAQPFHIGGMVQGAAPNVGVMDFGNHYYGGTDEDEYLVVALGYDGVPNSGDEVQVASNSYGNFTQMWGGWGYFGRLITALNTSIAPTSVWVFSGGNEGPGYGPQEGEGGPTIVKAGTSTQFGSTNWDSIAGPDQIVYGDPSSFGSKGPNNDGSAGLDVLGNGGRGAGDEGLNYFGFDGATSWDTWGGTSRSAPVVAGNLALLFEAYQDRYGSWPTWDTVMALTKSSATNSVSSPFLQGAGVVNSDRATDLAAGIYGVYTTPDEWQVGDWEGVEYMNFAKVAYPGDTFEKTFTVHNPSSYDIKAGLSEGVMTLINKKELTFTTSDESQESVFNFHAPDYLMSLNENVTIPQDAEVMVVRYVHPYSTFDPASDFTANANSSWRFMLYNWTDVNGDGELWVDADDNGTVNHVGNGTFDNEGFERLDFAHTEVQEGEYVRMDYEFGGLSIPLYIHDPLDRMGDGYFFGFQHRHNDHTVPNTTFKIGVEFYKRADWTWLELDKTSLTVPAEESVAFEAEVTVPEGTAPGSYEGVIFVSDPGNAGHPAHESALPVVVNVIADLPDDGAVTIGGQPVADTMFQNSWTNGYFNWYGGGWTGAGDWRKYFFNVDAADLENKNMLVHTSWDDGYPTDFNTWVLGPTADCASNGMGVCAWFQPGAGQPNPAVFGPYTLQPIGSSEPFRATAAYPFNTSTGGPDDWVKVPLSKTGLHEIALHNVLYSGENLAAMFKSEIGTIDLEALMDPARGVVSVGSVDAEAYVASGSIDLQFTPTLEIPDLYATLAGGLSTTINGPFTSFVPDNGQCYDPFCAGNVYNPLMVTQPGTTRLVVHVYMPSNQDADFFLLYDANNDGAPTQNVDTVVASSGNGSGTDEEVTVSNPALGRYFAVLNGYDMDPNSGVNVNWDYRITAPGELPTEAMEVFSDTVAIDQDDKFDPTTASYTMTVTTGERTAAIHAELTAIPAGSDIDLYLTDGDGNLVAKSQTGGNESITVLPPEGEYRLGEGLSYTLWVHGFDVPVTVNPHLRVRTDELNLWLSAEDEDVHVSSIGAGETATVTLNFEKSGWAPGDAPLSARLIAGPSILPGAFDELITIERTNPPAAPVWDSSKLVITYTPSSARGPSPVDRWLINGIPSPTTLAAAGEEVTWTLTVTNTDPDFATPVLDLWAELDNLSINMLTGFPYKVQAFKEFVTTPAVGTYGYVPANAITGTPVVAWNGTLDPGQSFTMSWIGVMDPSLAPNQDLLSLVYDPAYWWTPGPGVWQDFMGADAFYRTFRTSDASSTLDSVKLSNPPAVAPGATFEYVISLMNPSAEDKEVYVSDVLPEEVSFVSASAGVSYDAATHTVSWSGLLPGTSLSSLDLTVEVALDEAVLEGALIMNVAEIAMKYQGAPVNTLTAYTLVDDGLNPWLSIHKSVDFRSQVAGGELEFTIVVENTGTETAHDATITDVLPAELVIAEDTLPVGATYADGVLTWVGDIAAGGKVTLTYQASVAADAAAGIAVINPATVSAGNHPWEAFGSSVTEVNGATVLHLPFVFRR